MGSFLRIRDETSVHQDCPIPIPSWQVENEPSLTGFVEKLWKTCREAEFLEFGCELYHTVSTMEAGIGSKSRCLWVSLVCLVLLTPMKSAVAQDYSTLDVRGKLVLANKILAMEGLVGPFGHVSVRLEGEGRFRISDHRSPNEVTVDHIKEVEIEITPEAVEEQGLYREVFIHSSIYRELPEVKAIVHTHAPYAVALGTLQRSDNNKVFPTTNPGANLGNFIPVFQPVGLISTPEKGMALARTLQGQNGVLLRGHGTVVVGTTLEQAVLRAIYLEFEARTQIRSRSAGEPIPYTTSESDLFKRTVAVEHAWHYYLDKFRQSVKNETPSHK